MLNRPNPNTTNSPTRNSLGIAPEVYEKLLERIESSATLALRDSDHRLHKRICYHSPFLSLSLSARHMSASTICVVTRNISRSGISVLHSNFIHPGTLATVSLQRLDSSVIPIRGKVVRCSHLSGIVHEVGIKFDIEIHPQEFIRFLPLDAFRSLNQTSPHQLTGKVDIITSNNELFNSVKEVLEDSDVHLQQYSNIDEFLLTDPTDDRVVISVHESPSSQGPLMAHKLRAADYQGPLILMGQIEAKQDTGAFQLSTADTFLPYPFDANDLYTALGEYLLHNWRPETLAKIRSYKDPGAIELIQNELAKISVRLDQLIRTKNVEGLINQCTIMESIAPLIGAHALVDISQQITQSLSNDAADFDSIQDQIQDAQLMIANMRKHAA